MSKVFKAIVLATLIILTAVSVTACGKDSVQGGNSKIEGVLEAKYLENGGKVPFTDLEGMTITVGAHWNPEPLKGSAEGELALKRIKYLEETYNFKFAWKAMIESEQVSQIESSVMAGKPVYDVGYLISWNVRPLVSKNILASVEDAKHINLADPKWSKCYTDLGAIDGKHYTFFSKDPTPPLMLFWNKTMFQKKGLPNLYELVKNNQWTFDKLQEIAVAATERNSSGEADIYGITGYNSIMREQVMISNGQRLLNIAEDGRPVLNVLNPDAVSAFQWLCDLNQKYKVMDEPEEVSWDYYGYQFKKGKVAMMANMCYMYESWSEMTDDYGIVPFPKGPKDTQYKSYTMASNPMVFLGNNPNLEKAAFIWDLYNEPYKDLGEDSWKLQMERFARDEESLEYMRMVSENTVVEEIYGYKDVEAIVHNALNNAFYGTSTITQELTAVEAQCQAMLDDIYNSRKKK